MLPLKYCGTRDSPIYFQEREVHMTTLTETEKMRDFEQWVRTFGYRAPTEADLQPQGKFIMVDVDQYLESSQGRRFTIAGSTTHITLDDEPIQSSSLDLDRRLVCYHCTIPHWEMQCFVPIEEFLASGCRDGMYANNTRYLLKT